MLSFILYVVLWLKKLYSSSFLYRICCGIFWPREVIWQLRPDRIRMYERLNRWSNLVPLARLQRKSRDNAGRDDDHPFSYYPTLRLSRAVMPRGFWRVRAFHPSAWLNQLEVAGVDTIYRDTWCCLLAFRRWRTICRISQLTPTILIYL